MANIYDIYLLGCLEMSFRKINKSNINCGRRLRLIKSLSLVWNNNYHITLPILKEKKYSFFFFLFFFLNSFLKVFLLRQESKMWSVFLLPYICIHTDTHTYYYTYTYIYMNTCIIHIIYMYIHTDIYFNVLLGIQGGRESVSYDLWPFLRKIFALRHSESSAARVT